MIFQCSKSTLNVLPEDDNPLLTYDCSSSPLDPPVIKETDLSSWIVRAIAQRVTSRDAVAYVRDNPPMMDSSLEAIYEKVSLRCNTFQF
jgi:hypothetical protein